jgi:hypothetical protein
MPTNSETGSPQQQVTALINSPTLFSVLLPALIVSLAVGLLWIVGGSVGGKLNEFTVLPQSLMTGLLAIGGIVMLISAKNVFQKPLWTLIALLVAFFWEVFFSKLTLLAFGLASVTALGVLFKHYQWLWKIPAFRLGLGFSLVSALYFFFYSSDFRLTSVQPGYQSVMFTNAADVPAKITVVVWALSVAVGFMTGLRVFIPAFKGGMQKSPAQWLQDWGIKLGLILLVLLGTLLAVFPIVMETNHLNIYLPPTLLFAQFIAGWIQSGLAAGVPLKTPQWTTPAKLSQWLGIVVILLWLLFPIIANKTLLISCSLILFVQAFICHKTGMGWFWGWPKLPKVSPLQLLISVVVTSILATMVLFATGLNTAIEEKIDYFAEGFSNPGTLGIREENLHHLFEDWESNLSPKIILMGNGLARSRHDIFFVSAQRRWQYGILVQTVHNVYVELFYDYGLMALLYFGTWLFLLSGAISTLRNPRTHLIAKHAATLIVCFAIYTSIYGLTDGIVAAFMAQLFTMLGLLEGIRRFWPLMPLAHKAHSNFSNTLAFKNRTLS